jgi:hypothetical protein
VNFKSFEVISMRNEMQLTVIERQAPAELIYHNQIYRKQMGTKPDYRLLCGLRNALLLEAVAAFVVVLLIALVKAI